MFDDMMHRGLWFAPTWPMMQERAARYHLVSNQISNQSMQIWAWHVRGRFTINEVKGSHISFTVYERWEPND